jgi:hypothetical protein
MNGRATDRTRWVSTASLASAGLLTLAAHVARLWSACAWGDYASAACFLASAESPSTRAVVLQGLATAALALGLVPLPQCFGRTERRHRVASGVIGVLGLLAAVGILPLAWFLAFPVLVFVALGSHRASWALVLGSPLFQVLILPGHTLGPGTYDVMPWGQLVTGLCLLVAAYAVRPRHHYSSVGVVALAR